jgi:hypothetical protein
MGMNVSSDILSNALLRMRWETERLGNPGKIGLGLLVFSAVFFVAAVLPRQEESSALRTRAEEMQARLRSQPAEKEDGSTSTTRKIVYGNQALKAFYAFFPNVDSTPFWIGEVVKAATQQGLELSGADYRMEREKEIKLARYEMVLPVRGQYAQVRGFVAEALRAVPAMSLADVAVKREGVASDLLDVNLKFNLYLSEGKK